MNIQDTYNLLTATKGDAKITYVNKIQDILTQRDMNINQLNHMMSASYSATHGIVTRATLDSIPLSRLCTMSRILDVEITDLYTVVELDKIVRFKYLNTIRLLCDILYREDSLNIKIDRPSEDLAKLFNEDTLFDDVHTDKDDYLVLCIDDKLIPNASELLTSLYKRYKIEVRHLIIHSIKERTTLNTSHDTYKQLVKSIIADDNEQKEILFLLEL